MADIGTRMIGNMFTLNQEQTELIILKLKHQLRLSDKIQLHVGEKTGHVARSCEELGRMLRYMHGDGETGKYNIQRLLLSYL